jgi:hypothetical protein
VKCLPPELQRQATRAEQRRDDAIDRLLRRLAGGAPTDAAFEHALQALLDADRNVINLLQRKSR